MAKGVSKKISSGGQRKNKTEK